MTSLFRKFCKIQNSEPELGISSSVTCENTCLNGNKYLLTHIYQQAKANTHTHTGTSTNI